MKDTGVIFTALINLVNMKYLLAYLYIYDNGISHKCTMSIRPAAGKRGEKGLNPQQAAPSNRFAVTQWNASFIIKILSLLSLFVWCFSHRPALWVHFSADLKTSEAANNDADWTTAFALIKGSNSYPTIGLVYVFSLANI